MCASVEIDPAGLDDAALAELVVSLQAEADRLEAARLQVFGEWDARAGWAIDGAPGGAGWLAARGSLARGTASALLRDARKLRTMDLTAAALAEGRLAPAKARLLAQAVTPRTREAFVGDQQVLLDSLVPLTVDQAADALRFWERNVDQDGPDPDDRDTNAVWLSKSFAGRFQMKADLDCEAGTELYNQLSARVEEIRRERRAEGVDLTGAGPGLRAEALMDLLRRSTAAPDTAPAARPLLWVFSSAETLSSGKGTAEVAGGGTIPAGTAQRLACDCDWAEIRVEGGHINLGRTRRRASPTQRRLLWLRDDGCAFPGCGRPPGWCEAHHLVFWDHGGPTDLDNLCLLCSHHHHLCHEGRWRAAREEGQLVFRRPDGSRLEPPLVAA